MELLTIKKVLEIVPISRSMIYNLIKSHSFPAPRRLPGGKKSFWLRDEVVDWLQKNLKLTTET